MCACGQPCTEVPCDMCECEHAALYKAQHTNSPEAKQKYEEMADLVKTHAASLDWKYKATDNIRMHLEAERENFDALKTRIVQRAIVALADSLRSSRLGNFKIKEAETDYDVDSRMGKVVVQTELLDGRDKKILPLEVIIAGDNMTLPTLSEVTSLLESTKAIVESEEVPAVLKKTASKKPVKKKAGAMSPTNDDYQEVLRLPKDFLPASLKEGDVIEVDGLRYALRSKSEGQLSKQKDTGSHWTFERVRDPYMKAIYRQESY